MKKKIFYIIFILILIIIIFFLIFRRKDYALTYIVDNYKIKESYHKKNGYYKFELQYDNIPLKLVTFDKYTHKRKLISKITKSKKKKNVCINLKSKYVNTYPLCINDNNVVSSYYNGEKENKIIKKINNYNIYNYNDNKFMFWNYKYFMYIDKNIIKKIKLFKKDYYNLNLIYVSNDFILVPNMDSKYKFSKMYYIDVNTLEIKTINLRYDIYFDSYFLGEYKDCVYLYDRKIKQEYYLNLNNNRIYKSKNMVRINNKWQEVSVHKLDKKIYFKNSNVVDYEIVNNKLYSVIDDKYKTLISTMNVRKIIKKDKLDVYFLSDNTLYYYSPYKGIKKIVENNEWEFNYKNMIYVFD